MIGLPDTKEQWIIVVAYALLDYFIGKNQALRPNSIPEVIEIGISMVLKRIFKKGVTNDTNNTVGQSCPNCGTKS